MKWKITNTVIRTIK